MANVAPSPLALDDLVMQARARDRVARRWATIFTLIPIVVGVVILGSVGWEIRRAETELATVDTQLTVAKSDLALAQTDASTQRRAAETLRVQVSELNGQVKTLSETLKLATDIQRFRYSGNILEDAKGIASRYPKQWPLLQSVLTLQTDRVPWKLGGTTPQEGFDSPSFAAYLLLQRKLLTGSIGDVRSRLPELLPLRASPQVGDLIFYQQNYAMFYFIDSGGRPFVIGMTPLGILALLPDFATRTDIRAITY